MESNLKEQAVKEYFNHVAIKTFVKYFFIFNKNKDIRSHAEIYKAFAENNEIWSKKSQTSRASKSKKIFRDKLELVALEYIVNDGNKVEEKCRLLASKILNIYQLQEKNNKMEHNSDEDLESGEAGKLVNKNFYSSEDLLFDSEPQFVKFFINLLVNNIAYMPEKSEDSLLEFAFQFFEVYEKDWYFSYYNSTKYYRIIPSEIAENVAVEEFIDTLVQLNQYDIYDLYDKINEVEY